MENITDVDDHVYEEADEQGIGSREVAERATGWFFEDTGDLGLGRPDVEPRASETIPEIIALVQKLIEAATPTKPAATSTSASRASPSTAGCRAHSSTR